MVNRHRGLGSESDQEEDIDRGFDNDDLEGGFSPVSEGQSQDSGENVESFDGGGKKSFDSLQDNQSSPDSQSFDDQAPDKEKQELERELETFEEEFGSGQSGPSQQDPGQQQTQGEQNQVRSARESGQQPQQRGQDRREEQHIPSSRSGSSESSDVDRLSSEVPKPPETREIDVPEIDRGPLFLRRQKFRRAKQLIDEMLYLSQEVESTVNTLEAGIQQDQSTERDIREMLKEVEGSRSDVEDIISPGEE